MKEDINAVQKSALPLRLNKLTFSNKRVITLEKRMHNERRVYDNCKRAYDYNVSLLAATTGKHSVSNPLSARN